MDFTKLTEDLKTKYPDIGIQKVQVDEASGKSTFFLKPTDKVLASLPTEKAINLHLPPSRATASTIRRDTIDRSVLDLIKTSVSTSDPHEIYKRSIKYYYEADVYGAHIDILTNLASKGFENDIDDDYDIDSELKEESYIYSSEEED